MNNLDVGRYESNKTPHIMIATKIVINTAAEPISFALPDNS